MSGTKPNTTGAHFTGILFWAAASPTYLAPLFDRERITGNSRADATVRRRAGAHQQPHLEGEFR